MSEFTILLLGDVERPEFQAEEERLGRWATVCRLADASEAAEAILAQRITPEVIVVAQSFPGQFSEQAIERLRQLAPVARVLGLIGSWCEGEMRSGLPWPATARTYWHQWPARSERQLARLASGQPCAWALPPTATEEERLLAAAGEGERGRGEEGETRRQGDKETNGLHPEAQSSCFPISVPPRLAPCHSAIVVHSASFEMWEWLAAACQSRGFSAVWQPAGTSIRVRGAAWGIFDATDLGPGERDALEKMAARLRPAPVVVLMSFPRVEDRKRALSAGAAAVLSKPLLAEDLWAEMDEHSPR
jgi:DNA-binding NarL/FixJ family response regulator